MGIEISNKDVYPMDIDIRDAIVRYREGNFQIVTISIWAVKLISEPNIPGKRFVYLWSRLQG